jgi:hypothetical protein
MASQDGSTTTLLFNRLSDGTDAAQPIRVAGHVSHGVVVGDVVFATGASKDSDADPGVIAISAVDRSVKNVVPAGPAPSGVSAPFERSLVISPSGRTLVSPVCTSGGCGGGEVIDTRTLRVIRTLGPHVWASAISDKFALVREGSVITTGLSLVRLDDGRTMWKVEDGTFANAYVTEAGMTVVLVTNDGPRLRTIDANGKSRVSGNLPGVDPRLWLQFSSTSLAVVGSGGPFPGDAATNGGMIRASAYDLSRLTAAPSKVTVNLLAVPAGG